MARGDNCYRTKPLFSLRVTGLTTLLAPQHQVRSFNVSASVVSSDDGKVPFGRGD